MRFRHLLFSPPINEAYSQDFDIIGGHIGSVAWPLADVFITTRPCLAGELTFSPYFLKSFIFIFIIFHSMGLTVHVFSLQLPIYFIVSLGCYGLLMVGVGLMTFPTCPREGLLLQKVLLPSYSQMHFHIIQQNFSSRSLECYLNFHVSFQRLNAPTWHFWNVLWMSISIIFKTNICTNVSAWVPFVGYWWGQRVP